MSTISVFSDISIGELGQIYSDNNWELSFFQYWWIVEQGDWYGKNGGDDEKYGVLGEFEPNILDKASILFLQVVDNKFVLN